MSEEWNKVEVEKPEEKEKIEYEVEEEKEKPVETKAEEVKE